MGAFVYEVLRLVQEAGNRFFCFSVKCLWLAIIFTI